MASGGGNGRDLYERRRKLKLSRAKLAGLAGCTPAYIATLEGGYRPTQSQVTERLWAALERAEKEAA